MLEALVHERASFYTLTYDDDNLPDAASVSPRHLQLFIKRLRKHRSVRFFGVGEYGDASERPHYHLALFGLDSTPDDAELVRRSWPSGHIYPGSLTVDSAQYIAGYVTKKMTQRDDERLQGRYPEFARMSNRPGIGANSIQSVAHALQDSKGWDKGLSDGDVPSMLKHGSRTLPLGRYMRTRLRKELGFEEGEPDEVAYARSAEMLTMYQNYLLDEKAKGNIPLGFKQALLEANKQKTLNMETRMKIFAAKKVKIV